MTIVKGKYLYRALGISLGLVILGSVFLIPFSYRGARPLTLYEVSRAITEFWREIPRLTEPVIALNYVFLLVFVMLVFAGLMGFFPLVSGLTSVLSMAVMSFSLFFLGSGIVVGSGYYVIWAVSVVMLCMGIWRKFV
ncbi:MAG: hypothetical protein NTY03_04865 [Candidatus Bathyarchaeota archaeon]|nr:hypothetical protein [Candidatus Bathyarchaeota archaeon]